MERCHIVPAALGGKGEPSNLVLLCHRCHLDNPNITDSEIMWDWIRAYGIAMYDTFWGSLGMKEYKFIYYKSFYDELDELGVENDKDFEQFMKSAIREVFKETSYHFGHPYMNMATCAGMYRMLLKKIAKRYGKELSPPDYDTPRKPWWMDV